MAAPRAKASLHDELCELLATDLETAERAQRSAHEAATHEDAKPENDKDTRALEQSYVARGQARRVEELRSDLALARAMPMREFAAGDRVSLGALVTVDEGDETLVIFVAPSGGGAKLSHGVQVATPSSPLGRALVGKVEGDDVEIALPGRVRLLSIRSVE